MQIVTKDFPQEFEFFAIYTFHTDAVKNKFGQIEEHTYHLGSKQLISV